MNTTITRCDFCKIGRSFKITKDDGDISYIEKVCKGLKEELHL